MRMHSINVNVTFRRVRRCICTCTCTCTGAGAGAGTGAGTGTGTCTCTCTHTHTLIQTLAHVFCCAAAPVGAACSACRGPPQVVTTQPVLRSTLSNEKIHRANAAGVHEEQERRGRQKQKQQQQDSNSHDDNSAKLISVITTTKPSPPVPTMAIAFRACKPWLSAPCPHTRPSAPAGMPQGMQQRSCS